MSETPLPDAHSLKPIERKSGCSSQLAFVRRTLQEIKDEAQPHY
jgi:hypothetical protein